MKSNINNALIVSYPEAINNESIQKTILWHIGIKEFYNQLYAREEVKKEETTMTV